MPVRAQQKIIGEKTFDWFLKINGFLGTILLGAAVGTFFTGANFTVDRFNMANLGGDTTISQWTTPWHGLEAVLDYRNVALGLAVLFLSRMLALHYFMNDIDDTQIRERSRRRNSFSWFLSSPIRPATPIAADSIHQRRCTDAVHM